MKKPRGYWTYEKCKEAALLCKTKIELKKTKRIIREFCVNIQNYLR